MHKIKEDTVMNYEKIDILLGMKNVQRLPNAPHHQGYNLMEHCFVVGVLFRWFASQENVPYDITVWDKVLMHDYVESVTGDLNLMVKKHSPVTAECWNRIEADICESDPCLRPYTDAKIKESMTDLQFRLFKCCDYLDLWIFCVNERALGNNHPKITACIANCRKLILSHSNQGNEFKSILNFMNNYEYRMGK